MSTKEENSVHKPQLSGEKGEPKPNRTEVFLLSSLTMPYRRAKPAYTQELTIPFFCCACLSRPARVALKWLQSDCSIQCSIAKQWYIFQVFARLTFCSIPSQGNFQLRYQSGFVIFYGPVPFLLSVFGHCMMHFSRKEIAGITRQMVQTTFL